MSQEYEFRVAKLLQETIRHEDCLRMIIDQVAEHVLAVEGEYDFVNDLSPWTPPAEATWAEWAEPQWALQDGRMQPHPGNKRVPQRGVLTICLEPPRPCSSPVNSSIWELQEVARAMAKTRPECRPPAGTRWWLFCHFACLFPEVGPRKIPGSYLMFLDKDGTWLTGTQFGVAGMSDEGMDSIQLMIRYMLTMAGFTFSVASCKNVTYQDVTDLDAPPAKWFRRNRVPTLRLKTLKIPGLRDIVVRRRPYDYITDGLPHPLQKLRGHFKNYTEEAPLFGKHIGRYWWHRHARGSDENGVIAKDYEVELPPE
jgi:hypothetical protein